MRYFPSYTECNSFSGKDRKQSSLEKAREDKEDPKEYLDEFFRNLYRGVAYFVAYTRTRENTIQIPFLYCFIILITMLKSKQLIQGLKMVRSCDGKNSSKSYFRF